MSSGESATTPALSHTSLYYSLVTGSDNTNLFCPSNTSKDVNPDGLKVKTQFPPIEMSIIVKVVPHSLVVLLP